MIFKTISLLAILFITSSCSIMSDFSMSSEDQNELRMSEEALEILYKKHGITHRNVIEVAVPKPNKKVSKVSEEVLIDSEGREVK